MGIAADDVSARFCLLEQLIPDGVDHPFAQTMMAHFAKLQTPIKAVEKYPTVSAQEKRFQALGWASTSARNLWELWGDCNFVTSTERRSLDLIEPFDEWEEFALFGCHYFLLVADNATANSEPTYESKAPGKPLMATPSPFIHLETSYSECPKSQGYRRFGAALPVRSHSRTHDRIGNFSGMGLSTRDNAYDVYTTDELGSVPFNPDGSDTVPCSRMCHTITDLGDLGALLVGGRSSPANARADCWLYHKWLNVWEQVDDLPEPRYRHGAVYLGEGKVLVSPGRRDSQHLASEYLIWSRRSGWVKCRQSGAPPATYGSVFVMYGLKRSFDLLPSIRGVVTGGMSEDGILQQDVWQWDLRDYSSEVSIHLQACKITHVLSTHDERCSN